MFITNSVLYDDDFVLEIKTGCLYTNQTYNSLGYVFVLFYALFNLFLLNQLHFIHVKLDFFLSL